MGLDEEGTVKRSVLVSSIRRPIPLSFIMMASFVVHLPLLLMKSPMESFGTNFFDFQYVPRCFDPWNAKWWGL